MKTGQLTARKSFFLLLILSSLFIFDSCVDPRLSKNFNGLEDGSITAPAASLEPVVTKGDILSISVSSPSREESERFNAPNIAGSTVGTNGATNISPSSGYLVNQDGYIQFPALGNIMAAGLTKQKLKDDIQRMLVENKLLVDPIVTIRYLNFRVTVLGEVARPTVVAVPNEKISILEALGLAGDMTIYAKRDNVLIIREDKNGKTIKRVNLNNTEIFTSSYYYLKSNDIVYVEPNKQRIASTSRLTQLLPIIISGLSFTAIILDRVLNPR
jgi:polysaccharide biosynthesis/export protein